MQSEGEKERVAVVGRLVEGAEDGCRVDWPWRSWP